MVICTCADELNHMHSHHVYVYVRADDRSHLHRLTMVHTGSFRKNDLLYMLIKRPYIGSSKLNPFLYLGGGDRIYANLNLMQKHF